MSTVAESEPRWERTVLYIGSAVVLGLLLVIGLFTFSSARESVQASQKADQLIAALESTGARVPSKDSIVRVLGSDGGAVCVNPGKSLAHATLFSMLANGAAGPGARPVIADSRVLQGELLIIKTYCPEQLTGFQDFVNKLKSADVAGG